MKRKNFYKISTAWAAVMAVLIFAGCLGGGLPGTGSEVLDPPSDTTTPPDTKTPGDETPPPLVDDPAKNTMTLETGNKIFALVDDAVNKGWRIAGFKSATQLAAYLELGSQKQLSRAVAAEIVEVRYNFTIPTIGGKPVTSITEWAFLPSKNNGQDISTVVSTIHIPETVVEMTKIDLGATAQPITVDIPKVVLDRITQKEDIKEEEVVTGDKVTVTTPAGGGGGGSKTIVEGPPTLKTAVVSYNPSTTNPTTVTFTFEKAVTAVTKPTTDWVVSGTNSAVITAVYSGKGYGSNQAISFTAASSSGKTTEVGPVTALAVRPFPTTETAAYYTIKQYNPTLHTAIVQKEGQTTALDGFLVADSNWQKLFNAIYTPNAPDSPADTIETSTPKKTTIPYDSTISETALKLFKIKIGGGAAYNTNRVEIRGDVLPTDSEASTANLIVIDIGVPGGTDNGNLKFIIPYKKLGVANNSLGYGYVRFRVNKGADLVIQADNSKYEQDGAGNACDPGYFNLGCVEVMEGGYLRDGAYEGFPLGDHAVLLNRWGSYLGVGPEEKDVKGTMTATYNAYYKGWLVGPSAIKPKIEWDTGGKAEDYLEVRPGKLAISTNMTVRKSVGLIYNVWLVGSIKVTIDTKDDAGFSLTFNNQEVTLKGLFANFKATSPATTAYKIYGTSGATIAIKPGNTIHQGFLTPNGDMYADYGKVITVPDNGPDKTISNGGTLVNGSEVYATTIVGYLDWSPLD